MDLKLEVELVPKTCWYSNLRNVFTQQEWKLVRNYICDFRFTDNKCDICGQRAYFLEAHEQWEYDMKKHIQRSVRIRPLCTNCHKVKHWGLAQLQGELDLVVNHFLTVNQCSEKVLTKHLQKAQQLFEKRNKITNWKLDMSYLKTIHFEKLYDKYNNKE